MFTNSNEKLTELLKDFYNLTHMKICVYDSDGVEISYYPDRFTQFCGYIRQIKEVNNKCIECDNNSVNLCKSTRKSHIYTCHCGLTECIAPILINNEINGFIAIGQIRENVNYKYIPEFETCDKNKLNEYYNNLEIISRDKIFSALHVLEACAGYEQLKQFVSKKQNSFKLKLEDYIYNNLNGNLEVNILCDVLKVSRVELYRQIKDIYGSTPADLIKNIRLEKAKQLLLNNNKIVDIAEICGLGDYNYFSKQFKKKYKLSPRNFKNNKV